MNYPKLIREAHLRHYRQRANKNFTEYQVLHEEHGQDFAYSQENLVKTLEAIDMLQIEKENTSAHEKRYELLLQHQ